MWVNRQLNKSSGSYTDVVEATELVKTNPQIIIKNVSVLSSDCTAFIANQNVALSDGIIKSINKHSILDDSFTIVDGQGKYLIPGLVDSHVHLRDSKNDLLLYLANGVTHIREMTGNKTHLKWREEIDQGTVGPKMFVASEKVHSTGGVVGMFESWTRKRINYATEKAVAKKIKQLHEDGFDAVKISTFINEEMYRATVREAKKYNLPVIGHIPFSIGLDNIYDSGQCEIAHVEEITKDVIRNFKGDIAANPKEFLKYLEKQSDDIAKKIRDKDIVVSTTIWLMESLPRQKFSINDIIKEVELEYVNPGTIEGTRLGRGWLPGNNSYAVSDETMSDPDKREKSQIFWNTYVDAIHIMTKSLSENNVKILAGTDATVPVTVAGFSLHDEMISLSKAGMNNSQVLFSATVAPAFWMKTKAGKIEEGYDADLLLLNKNPLEKIENTSSIESIFNGTHWLDRNNIVQILKSISEANENSRNIDISEYIN